MAVRDTDPYEEELEEFRRKIKDKARLRDETSYKGSVWLRLQDEIDRLTEEMLEFEASIPELRRADRTEARQLRKFGVMLLLASGLILTAVILGWFSPWWLIGVAVLAFLGIGGLLPD
ncbi:hypothetical protein [Saccharothrix obliqua]|uniref:hypothetical protein n=1 Tax=Saccharothrix obliqua TaxID=2861747 RepID=UPI001C5E4F8B|nr:hypothetical protein [Saccharothrix obliqua]MBW4717409.1 hypothetical protein [Saccharothrix obliqua]